MCMWLLTFQDDGLPIAVGKNDGAREIPPPGLVQYIELARGAWTIEPAAKPLGVEGGEQPKPCVWRAVTGCAGAMPYVEHVKKPIILAQIREITHPAGWQCDTCGCEEVDGFSSLTWEWREPTRDEHAWRQSRHPAQVAPQSKERPRFGASTRFATTRHQRCRQQALAAIR